MTRHLIIVAATLTLTGAAAPENRLTVTLPRALVEDAGGRLLVFAEPATPDNEDTDTVDIGDGDRREVFVAGRDVARFGPGRVAVVDAGRNAFPHSMAALPPGLYRMQAVLDRNGDYAYGGRGPGDLVSRVVTLRLPLASMPSIALDHIAPPGPDQFDVAGLPPRAAEQVLASRAHLHEERVASPLLTRFWRSDRSISAWVLTPPGYDLKAHATYPTVFTAGGFGANHRLDGQQLSRQWHLMETGEIPPMIWVALDYGGPTGTTEFANSVNNGPWGDALVTEVIPALEARYRMDAKASGRFLTGHSSGGWFALWTMVRHPALFGGAWATSPDPPDFHDFLGVNLYAHGANMYRDTTGAARPLERDRGGVRMTIEQGAKLEAVLGHDGGQLRSFEWVFSPRGGDGAPVPLFDRATGKVDRAVAAYWRDRHDIVRIVKAKWPRCRVLLDDKLHVAVGTADSYGLDGSVRRMDAAIRAIGGRAAFTYVSGASHSMAEVYARGGDRSALWKEMTAAMYAIARPQSGASKPSHEVASCLTPRNGGN